jgi:cytochrome P450
VTSLVDHLVFDPFSFEAHADPYPLYRRLRDEQPVYHNSDRGFYAVSRFEDVQRVERDWQVFSHEQGVDLDDFGTLEGDGDFLNMDPPRHDVLRAAVRQFFTPKAIGELESDVRVRVRGLLAEIRDESHVDLAERFAWRLPLRMISTMMGIPAVDEGALLNLVHDAEFRVPYETKLPESARAAIAKLLVYFTDLCESRALAPHGDVSSAIAAKSVDDPASLPREAIPGICFLLFVAGVSTTASLIGNGIDQLVHRHDAWDELTTSPTHTAEAIEELLRFDAPIQYFKKTATTDVTMRGVSIPAGAPVVVLYGAANRDERVYGNPETLDFRRDFRKHKAFGDGIHFCLGAHLARLEGRIALEELFAAIEDYEITGPRELIPLHHFRGFLHLGAELKWAKHEG